MFGLGKKKSAELDFLEHNKDTILAAFVDYIELATDKENPDPELLHGIFNLQGGVLRLVGIMTQREEPFDAILNALSKDERANVADNLIKEGSDLGDELGLSEITFYLPAILLYHSIGAIQVDPNTLGAIKTVIQQSQ